MTTTTSDIITAIKANVESITGFIELPQVTNIENNSKRMTHNRYGVLPAEANQVSGSTRYITVDQTFLITLTNDYVRLRTDDSSKRDAISALYNSHLEIYKTIVCNKLGIPDIILNIKEMSFSSHEDYANEDTVAVTMSIVITYRLSF
jgi:hypothetical protein